MLKREDIKEGDKLRWLTGSGYAVGYVVEERGKLLVYTDSTHNFALESLIGSESIQKVGSLRVRTK